MSYFIEHGIQETTNKTRYSNPDIADFMSPATEAFQQFQSLRQVIGNSTVLQQILEQLVSDIDLEQKPLTASKAFLAGLEILTNLQDQCSICLDTCTKESHRLPCKHTFHKDCILPWLQVHHTCPLCRYELPTDNEEYELKKKRERDQKIRDEDSEEEWDPFFG